MPFFEAEQLGIIWALVYMAVGILLAIGMLILALLINMGEKKIRILFQKRTVGMKQYGMQNQVFPLKVTQAGITPIIYALTISLLPSVIIAMVIPGSENVWAAGFINMPTSVAFIPFFVIFVVFFTYIFAMMQFNPYDISNQIKQNSGYIQGIKPGKPTSQYLMALYSNLNSADCAYLLFVCVIPMVLSFIPGLRDIAFSGIGLVLVAGGFIEMKTLLDNALKTEEEKAKQAGKDKKRKNYNKK
jgi:preprotein translocase subunit SecY